MAQDGRRSSASSFAARLGLKPLSSITQPSVDQQGRSMSTPGGSPAASPAHSRRSSHSEAVSMSSLPARSYGAYPTPGSYPVGTKSRRASTVAGDLPSGAGGSTAASKNANHEDAGSRVHARKPSTVERNPHVVRRGSSIYGQALSGGRLSMVGASTHDAEAQQEEAEQDRAERLKTNTSALVLAAKNVLGWDMPDESGESELGRLLGLLFWDGANLKNEVTGKLQH